MSQDTPPALLASDLSRRVVDSAVWTVGVRATAAGLQAIVFVCLARLLSPSEFGTYALALVFVNLAAVLGHSGLRAAVVQAPLLSTTTIRAAVGLTVAVGLLGWLTIAVVAYVGFRAPLAPVLTAGGLNFCLLNLAAVPLACLQRSLRYRELMLIELAGSIVGSAAVTLALALSGWGVWSLVVGGIVRDGIIATLALVRYPTGIGLPRRGQGLRPLLGYGGTVALTNMAQYVSQNVDYLIVGQLLGSRALGFYSRAFYMTGRLNSLLVQGQHGVLLAGFARASDDRTRLRSGFLRATRMLCTLAFPLFTAVGLMAHDLVGLLLGPGWLELVPTLRVCCFLAAWPSLSTVADALLKATGDLGPQLRRHLLQAGLVIVAAAIGTLGGPVGAALGVALAAGVVYALLTGYVLRQYDITLRDYVAALMPGLGLAGMVAVVWMGVQSLPAIADLPGARLLAMLLGLLAAAVAVASFVPRRWLAGLRPELVLLAHWLTALRRRIA